MVKKLIPLKPGRRSLCCWLVGALGACSDPLPPELSDYRSECLRMNCDPIVEKNDDPHRGVKHVFACGIELEDLQANTRPISDGVSIIKESRRSESNYAWLVAVAQKQGGSWRWDEYTRNFEDEQFRHIAAGEDVCIECHQNVRAGDFIYTYYDFEPGCSQD